MVTFLSLSICYLCFIVNKILAYAIWKSFSFHFIKIWIRPNIFGIRVVYVISVYIFIPKIAWKLLKTGCLTYKRDGASAEFSSVNLSTLLWRSWNMMDPLLLFRFSSSIITSLGTLIFFPRFRPSHTHTLALVILVSFILDLCQVFYSMGIIFMRVLFLEQFFTMVLNDEYIVFSKQFFI